MSSTAFQRVASPESPRAASLQRNDAGDRRDPRDRRRIPQPKASGPEEAPPIVDEVLRTQGAPLDAPTRRFHELRFGHSFSHVRVHTDRKAAASAASVNALAYTAGRHVVFGAGQHAPETDRGRQLLAHELAHVVQQRSVTTPAPGALRIDAPDSHLERQAGSAAADSTGQGALPWGALTAVSSPRLSRFSLGGALGSVGDYFGGIGRTVSRAFGSEGYDEQELQDYLAVVTTKDNIENSFDSDNKARAIVHRWKKGEPAYQLTPRQKSLLVREMQSGATLDADERAILDLLKGSENGDLRLIFTDIRVDDLLGDFDGAEAKELKAWLEVRFEGGAAALRTDQPRPQGWLRGSAPLFPYRWDELRRKFESGEYEPYEIIEELARHTLAERDQAARDLTAARVTLQADILKLGDQKAQAADKPAADALERQMRVLIKRSRRMELVMEEAFKDVVIAEPPAVLAGKAKTLTATEKTEALKALKPEGSKPSGAAFEDKLPGESETYEQKLRGLTPRLIQRYWDLAAKHRQPSDHSDPAKMHTLKEMEDLALVSKTETDGVFGKYYDPSKHPPMKADTSSTRGSLHDLWADMEALFGNPKTKFSQKREFARALVSYFFQSDDKLVAPLNRAHNASPSFSKGKPVNEEAKAQAKIIDEFTATPAQVKILNEIDRGWDASADPSTREINIQLFRPKGGPTEDQDFMWDMFQTLIHEYLHTLVAAPYEKFARSFGSGSLEENTLMEGMDSFLDEVAWANIQPRVKDPAMREKVEGPVNAKLPAITVVHPSRRRYPSYSQAVKLINIVGFRNAVLAYFNGDIEKIGGPKP
jgi:hypothetical protein